MAGSVAIPPASPEHAVLRNATSSWAQMCREKTESDLKVQLSLVIRTFLHQSGVQIVLMHVFHKWKQYVNYIGFKERNAHLNGQVRQFETLCVQLKLQRADEAYELLSHNIRR